jgi:hypothetical protein
MGEDLNIQISLSLSLSPLFERLIAVVTSAGAKFGGLATLHRDPRREKRSGYEQKSWSHRGHYTGAS